MTIRSEFRAIVGLDVPDDDDGLLPSEAIRRLWVQMADSYDPLRLAPIWKYHVYMTHQYAEQTGRPVGVMQAFWGVMVQVCAFTDSDAPRMFPGMQGHIDSITEPSWGRIQEAVEDLAASWADIGL